MKTYIDMVNDANKIASEEVDRDKNIVSWTQIRDSWLGAFCMAEILNNQKLIKYK